MNNFSALPFKCPSCGSYMVHKIGTYKLECINCKSTKAIDAKPANNIKKPLESATDKLNGVKKLIDCPGCGANIEFKKFELSKNCPYCKNPLVTKCVNPLKIDSIIPFSIDKNSAKDIFKNWLGSLWFAPNNLSNLKDFEHQFTPTYIPFFAFDCGSYSTYTGQRGDAYYVEVQKEVYINGRLSIVRELERRVRWYNVSGEISRDFRDILIDAQENLPPIIKKLKGFDLNVQITYNPSFLSGYNASEYSKDINKAYLEAKEYMKRIIYKDVLWDIGGDEQRVFNINSNFFNQAYEVTLLPVWISSFKYKNKDYTIAINGLSGEIVGQRPYSYVKIFTLIFIIFVIIGTLSYLDNRYHFFDKGINIETDFNKRYNLP
jgi:ssDNA-binding Zn-finger/Zn-ribbon topoisomerase 1